MSFTDTTAKKTKANWETPQAFFDAVNAEFQFDLDVCASRENAKCAKYFTIVENGLEQAWSGMCWMNPPYGKEIHGWLAKAKAERERGITTVCLIPSRTDNAWWHRHVMEADEIRFLQGRLKFVGAKDGAKFASALAIFRGKRQPHALATAMVNWDLFSTQGRFCGAGVEERR